MALPIELLSTGRELPVAHIQRFRGSALRVTWYKTGKELACYWDDQPNRLWVGPNKIHISSNTEKVKRPERPTDW